MRNSLLESKKRIHIFLIVFVLSSIQTIAVGDTPLGLQPPSTLTFTPENLLAHNIARLKRDQCDSAEIRLVNLKLFGIDAANALLTGNFDVVPRFYPQVLQTYGLVLRTSDAGRTWVQVLDAVDRRIPYISDVKFIDRRGLLLYEHSLAGNSFGFLYSQNAGETWIDSNLEGISGSYYLVDWSVRRPHQGIAVVHSDSGVPINSDINRETKYWVIETKGGRRWTIQRAIQRGEAGGFDPDAVLWSSEWDEPDDSWRLVSDSGRAYVVHASVGQPDQEILLLPVGAICKSTDNDPGLRCDHP